MKVLSLFDGIACGKVALDRAGIPVDRYIAYEIEKDAIAVATHNHPMIEERGDVFATDFEDCKDCNLLIGGSPCQFWSGAQRSGIRETKSEGIGWNLFSRFTSALEVVQPEFFLYENNKSMHNDVRDAIRQAFGFEEICINSALLSAQQRLRYYWFGKRNPDGTYSRIEIALPDDRKLMVKDILQPEAEDEDDLISYVSFNGKENNSSYIPKPLRIGTIGNGGQAERVYSIYGKSTTLSANGGGRGAKTGLYLIDGKVRKLLPIEAERLQTLPDNYTSIIKSKPKRTGLCGNGWTVNVITYMFQKIN